MLSQKTNRPLKSQNSHRHNEIAQNPRCLTSFATRNEISSQTTANEPRLPNTTKTKHAQCNLAIGNCHPQTTKHDRTDRSKHNFDAPRHADTDDMAISETTHFQYQLIPPITTNHKNQQCHTINLNDGLWVRAQILCKKQVQSAGARKMCKMMFRVFQKINLKYSLGVLVLKF